MAHIEAVRVVQDPAYAASLTDSDWKDLASQADWNEMIGEPYTFQPQFPRR